MTTETAGSAAEIGVPGDVPACRFCAAPLKHTFVDLGVSPLCESFLGADRLNEMEPFYPLHVRVCERCFLVQLEEYVAPEEIFSEYAYFSSYSDSWVRHAESYAEQMIDRFAIGRESKVVEIASNDGYLLQHFVARSIPSLGVEPAANVARAAAQIGVDTRVAFFGRDEARRMRAEGHAADLMAANNVLAQVPDVNDFVAGFAELLAPGGVATFEFPHLLRLIEQCQYDTIYHEHFSYFSLMTTERILDAHGLEVFDVEELPSHGGSLRVFAAHPGAHAPTGRLEALRTTEAEAGLGRLAAYEAFDESVRASKRALLAFLVDAREAGKRIAAYGAPGKGNTLLNYCGIGPDLIEFTVDRNPYKHGRFTPGTRIPIHPPERLDRERPDVIVILPWNLRREIAQQLAHTREWGAQLVVPVPTTEVIA